MNKTVFVDSDATCWESKEEFLESGQEEDCLLGEYTLKTTYKQKTQLVVDT